MKPAIVAKLQDLFLDPTMAISQLRAIIDDWADDLQEEQPHATVTIGSYRNAALILGDLAYEYEEAIE